MERLVRSWYKREGGYVFAKRAEDIAREYGIEKVARLASNENPNPPPESVMDAARTALLTVNRYPDERAALLTNALRARYGDYNFVCGGGLDGVIETILRVLVGPDEGVAISTPTFSFYTLAAGGQGASIFTVPRREDFSIDVRALIRSAADAKVVIVCSPNNPSGNASPVEQVAELLEGIEGVLFLDNAYGEFSDCDYLPLMKKFENLILGRTFSKVHSLAGLRIGYAFVPRWFVPWYQRASTPFSISSVAMAAAAAALKEQDSQDRYIAHVRRWRRRFADEVKYPVLPSDANFVMIDAAPRTADEITAELARHGVLVRSCRSFAGLPDTYIRVSVGEDWENERFVRAMNAL